MNRLLRRFPSAVNHRGRELKVWLGVVVTAAITVWVVASTLVSLASGDGLAPWRHRLLLATIGVIAVCLAGQLN